MLNHRNYGQILQPRDCHTAVDRKLDCISLGIPDIDVPTFSSLSKSGTRKPYLVTITQGLPCQIAFNRNFCCITFGSLKCGNHKSYGRLLQLRDCHTAVDRKFGCNSVGIPDIDILPFSSLSKSGITKTVSHNYCLRATKLALIEIFDRSLWEVTYKHCANF